ncbi:MAG: sensor histidine kinase [Waterburya sp.]
MHHVLINLLSNAIKYSPNGSKIEFEILGEKEQVIIEIKDQGIGISEVDQPQIFEPFFRGSNVDSLPGNGLGLSIVKNLVQIHGGKIEVESKVGIGTKFSLTLAVLPIL